MDIQRSLKSKKQEKSVLIIMITSIICFTPLLMFLTWKMMWSLQNYAMDLTHKTKELRKEKKTYVVIPKFCQLV